jgi:hypothetical protein
LDLRRDMSGKGKCKTRPKIESCKYPSWHGSHQSMVDNSYCLKDERFVVCVDDNGPYVTEKSALDNRMADPNRTASVEYRLKQLNNLKC